MIILATYDVNLASKRAAAHMLPFLSHLRHPFPGSFEHVVAHASFSSSVSVSIATQDEGVPVIGFTKAEV